MRPNSPQRDDHGVSSRPRSCRSLEQGASTPGRNSGTTSSRHLRNVGERPRAVDVPGDFVEDRLEHVDGDEAHAGFDQPAGQQARLAEARPAVAVAASRRAPGRGRTPRGPAATTSADTPAESCRRVAWRRRWPRTLPIAPSTASRSFCRRSARIGGCSRAAAGPAPGSSDRRGRR